MVCALEVSVGTSRQHKMRCGDVSHEQGKGGLQSSCHLTTKVQYQNLIIPKACLLKLLDLRC